ncbi:MAG: NosD domain-containing protein, partial [Candidatus Aenigmatarchaeota archaeon]
NNIYGIYLEDSSNNKIYNNFFNNTNNFGFNEANVNDWNTTRTVKINIIGGPYLGGNFWAKPDGTGFSETCSDNNKDGICDSSYTLDSNNIDYLPLTFYFNRAPQITLNEPINNSQFNTQDINFKFIVIDDLNTTLTCSIYLDGTLKQTNSSVQNNTLTNFLITGISYGSHSWYINCSDGELINVSEVRYFTIATSSGGGGGAGGGGVIGGGGSSSGTGDVSSGSTSNQFDIFPGKPKIVQINSDIVKAITILVESDNRNASLNFSIKKCPAIDTRRLIYACFEVSHNITNITQANISFCVNNSWIVQHDVRTIILARLTNNWDSLLTIRRVASDNQTCFEAISPGLSWFAILGLDIPQICQPLTRRCAESKIQQCNIEGTNWYDIEVCDYGCDPLTLTCKPKPLSQSSECQAGQKRCFDNWVQICSDGQWQSQQFCQFGCVDGFCLKKTNSTIVWIIVGIIVSVVIVMFSLKKTVLR